MRWTMGWGAFAAALVLAGCPVDNRDPPPVFNHLPEVSAELNDADPMTDGATIKLDISDRDGEQCALTVEFSLDDGESYEPATVPQITGGNLHELSCPESSETYTLVWDTETDLDGVLATRVLLRLQVEDAEELGPPAHLHIPLVTTGVVVGGDYYARPNAQGAQWAWIQLFLVHVDVQAADVATTGMYLDGGDEFINNGEPPHSWEYALPTPPPEEHFQVLGPDDPGEDGEAAFYIPTAFRDDDTSGSYETGDRFLGVPAKQLLAFFRPDGNWIEEGWHVMEYDVFEEGGSITPVSIDTPVPLLLKNYPVESGEVVLDVSVPSIDAQPRRCGLMPKVNGTQIPSNNYEMTSILFDPIPSVMTMPVDAGWIQGSHWQDKENWKNFADVYAGEWFYLYRDMDSSGDASNAEPVTHVGQHEADGRPLNLIYFDGEMDWDNLFLWTIDECWRGFNLVTFPEKVIPKSPDLPYFTYECHPLEPGLTLEFLTQ